MLYSPKAVEDLARDGEHMGALEPGGDLHREVVATEKVVLPGTGSPGLDYELFFHRGDSGDEVERLCRERATVGLEINGNVEHVRDGYDLIKFLTDAFDLTDVPIIKKHMSEGECL